MIALVQRVSEAEVVIGGEKYSQIAQGLLILLGIEEADNDDDIDWLSSKLVNLRIFSDEEGRMNKSVMDIGGEIMVISQFTLHASTKKGNRPSFIRAAKPETAVPLYERFIEVLDTRMDQKVACGQFGADMKVKLVNDGPVTIHIDSKNRI